MKENADKTRLSIPKVRKVCGYEIKKMPIGRYLEAMEEISEFPSGLIDECFPGMELHEIIEKLAAFDEKMLKAVVTNALTKAPRYFVGFTARLIGVREEDLLNDENVGLDGLAEIIEAFIEVNRLGKFAASAVRLKAELERRSADIGFKALLQQG